MPRYGRKSSDRRGLAICHRFGTVCDATDRVLDHRAGWVKTADADLTPGFDTWHPRDRYRFIGRPDPVPVERASPWPPERAPRAAVVAAAYLLMEDGTPLLLEDGTPILLEAVI